MNKSTFSLASAAAALVLSATTAWADVVTIDLNQNNLGIVGTIGTVTVNRTTTTTATITFQANSGYRFTDGGSAAVNVNATTWTATNFSPAILMDGGSGSEDGMGTFNQTFNLPNSFPDSQTTISFLLTDTSGTWASAATVLKLNTPGGNGGGYAAAHFGVCSPSATSCTSFAYPNTDGTGFAAGNIETFPGGSNVLEPNSASLALLALGLLGAGFWTRRKV